MAKDFNERVQELIAEVLPKYGGDVEEYEDWGYSTDVAKAMVAEDLAKATYTATLWAEREARGWKRGGHRPAPRFKSRRVDIAKLEKKLATYQRRIIEKSESRRARTFPWNLLLNRNKAKAAEIEAKLKEMRG